MFNLSSFLRANNPLNMVYRMNHGKHNKKYLYRDGKLINGTIYYYPKKGEETAEPVEEVTPPKMFRISRVKSVKGNPYWERRLLRDFGLMEKPNVSVVKNIPENNARLWKIKHLIKITPINFVNGEPTADDLNHTYLKENGDCVVIKDIETLNKRLEATQKFAEDKKNFDGPTLRLDSRLKWLNNW